MKRFDIIVRNDSKSQLIAEEIKSKLIDNGCEFNPSNPELIVCVGGDGTLLNAFHDNIQSLDHLTFVGVHTGTLGFSTDYTVNEIDQLVEDISTKEPLIDYKAVLQVDCFNGDKNHTFYALNEIRVENIVKTQAIDVYINNNYFESFRGNGICVSGQHGSTAYNRSIGGAVLFPGLDLLQMTEISGIHHRHSRSLGAPLIMNSDAKISLRNETFKHALLCYDHLHIHLDLIKRIDIYNSSKTMKFARYRSIPHLKRLCSLF